MNDLYTTLGIKRNATGKEIKEAYRSLSKKYHPDISTEDPQIFIDINEAHTILSDTFKKKMYDEHGTSFSESEESINQWVYSTFRQLIDMWLRAKIDGGRVPNFPEFATGKIEENRKTANDGNKKLKKKKKDVLAYASYAMTDGNNIFSSVVQQIANELDRGINEHELMLYKTNLIEAEFKKYKFTEMEEHEIINFMGNLGTSTSSTYTIFTRG